MPALIATSSTTTAANEANAAAKNGDVGAVAMAMATASVPDALIYKYNRYVDGIFDKINRILKRSYDPVNVRLSTSVTYKQGNRKGQKKTRR